MNILIHDHVTWRLLRPHEAKRYAVYNVTNTDDSFPSAMDLAKGELYDVRVDVDA